MDQFDATHAVSIASNITDGQNRQIYPGTVIGGDYRLKKLLGRGGMGYVFLAEHIIIQKDYALKLVSETELSTTARQRFEAEARAIAALNHANIVKVHNMGLDSSRNPFYVMDLLNGKTLSDFVSESVGFSALIDLIIEVAAGLSYAHRKGIIHRDVKPSNILIVKENNKFTAKIVDFGIAKFVSTNSELQAHTQNGEILGSPLYMSPEQSSGELVDARTDIYSLGCTLFECLTGSAPYKGKSAVQTLLMHQNEPIPSLKNFCVEQGLPADLDTVVSKMLAKKRENRYQSMEQLIHDLERIKNGLAVGLKKAELPKAEIDEVSQTTTITTYFSKPKATIGIALGAAVLLAGMLFAWQKLQAPTESELPKKTNTKPTQTSEIETYGRTDENFANSFIDSGSRTFIENERKESAAAKAAYSKIKSVSAQQITINGRKIKRIVFPNWSIGKILVLNRAVVDASGSKDFAISDPLVLDCGTEKSHQLFTFPFVLNKVDNDMFDAFFITGRTSSADALPDESLIKIENDGLTSMLKTIHNWSRLKHLAIAKLTVSDQALDQISSLSNLESFQLRKCKINSQKLAQAAFLKKLVRFQLQSIANVSPILNGVAHSKHLQFLQLFGCKLSANDLKNFEDCPNLHSLEISGKSLPDLITEITLLPNLKVVKIGDTTLSTEQIHKLTKTKNIDKLFLKEQSYDFAAMEKIEAAEPKVEFYTSKPE